MHLGQRPWHTTSPSAMPRPTVRHRSLISAISKACAVVEADIWDRDYLDLCGPAMITITDHGRGEMAFGALQAGLDIEYSRRSIGFTWEGFDEMDEVRGEGSAELLDDGSIEIEFAYHDGDDAVLKAKRDTSSTA
jgi:hypothetical protein